MNPVLIAQIIALAEQSIVSGAQLLAGLRAAGVSTKTTAELLAQADANDDSIIATAQKELNPPGV